MSKLKSWPMAVAVMVVGAAVAITAFWFLGSKDMTLQATADSMLPGIVEGDRLQVRQLPGDQVHRGDIIVFVADAWAHDNSERGKTLAKRVIGVGGDTVAGDGDGRIQVNGKPITEEYRKKDDPNAGSLLGAFTAEVNQGDVFVAGDWRGNSRDSRLYFRDPGHGGVPQKDIKGIVVAVNGGPVVPTTAFTNAGLAGAPFHDDSASGPVRLLVMAGGLALFLGGVIWLIIALARRKT
jgi:signal peptidase I